MQTLKDLTSSLHDGASLQRLRDNLNELPKRWLARVEQPEDYLLGTVRGECNYHFKFRLEGGGYFQTGVLVASAEASPGGLPVPLKCRWKRKIGDLPVEIPGVTSNMYQISADDVGTDISVEAQPADFDDGHHGIVIGEIGPFELDPATRRSLDNALGLGGSRPACSDHERHPVITMIKALPHIASCLQSNTCPLHLQLKRRKSVCSYRTYNTTCWSGFLADPQNSLCGVRFADSIRVQPNKQMAAKANDLFHLCAERR
ncbi:unnamed protein product [Symbiodinium pilosum]|uniref:Uncharacterized protein n=1 Tax=Symbiodinium pilosum TaxID=2952 RepID=A0A812VET8_SYMPI|nr:unnamed protein product [Symbiodinium pilosum]